MNFYNIGDRSRALCEACDRLVETVFDLQDIPLSDGSKVVKGVLVSSCVECGRHCGLPQQSLSLVQEAVLTSKESIEARVSVAVDDLLRNACAKLGASGEFQGTLIRYYANVLNREGCRRKSLLAFLDSALVKGKKARRISIKGRRVKSDFDRLKTELKLDRYVECVEAIAYRVNEDIIKEGNADCMRELKNIYASVS